MVDHIDVADLLTKDVHSTESFLSWTQLEHSSIYGKI